LNKIDAASEENQGTAEVLAWFSGLFSFFFSFQYKKMLVKQFFLSANY